MTEWVVGTVGKGKKLHLLQKMDTMNWKRVSSACRGRVGKEVKGKKISEVTCKACMKTGKIWYSLYRKELENNV